MMVTKRDPQASADVRQCRRVDIPDSPGKPDRALKRVRGRAQTSPFTTRIENGAVETGIIPDFSIEKSGITLQADKILVGFCRATPAGQILLRPPLAGRQNSG